METGLMEIVRSLNRSWTYDTYFSLYIATCIHPGGKVRGEMSGYRFKHLMCMLGPIHNYYPCIHIGYSVREEICNRPISHSINLLVTFVFKEAVLSSNFINFLWLWPKFSMIFSLKWYFVLKFRSRINLCLQMVQFVRRISYFYSINY